MEDSAKILNTITAMYDVIEKYKVDDEYEKAKIEKIREHFNLTREKFKEIGIWAGKLAFQPLNQAMGDVITVELFELLSPTQYIIYDPTIDIKQFELTLNIEKSEAFPISFVTPMKETSYPIIRNPLDFPEWLFTSNYTKTKNSPPLI